MKRLLRNNGLAVTFSALFSGNASGRTTSLGTRRQQRDAPRTWPPSARRGRIRCQRPFSRSDHGKLGKRVPPDVRLRPGDGAPVSEGVGGVTGSRFSADRNRAHNGAVAPPVRRGGWRRTIYGHSLSLALFACFVVSFWLHARGGMQEQNEDARRHGKTQTVTALGYMGTSRFWFESFRTGRANSCRWRPWSSFQFFCARRDRPNPNPWKARMPIRGRKGKAGWLTSLSSHASTQYQHAVRLHDHTLFG